MTDMMAALGVLARLPGTARDYALATFYEKFAEDALVIDKWFSVQAIQPEPDVLARVRGLMAHQAFSITNPNRVRALVGTFVHGNLTQFNAEDGSGFSFAADVVLQLDRINAQVAARLLSCFRSWRSLEPVRRGHALTSL